MSQYWYVEYLCNILVANTTVIKFLKLNDSTYGHLRAGGLVSPWFLDTS